MRSLAVVLLAAAAAACVGTSTTAGSSTGTRPALRLSDDGPLTFSGSGFRADERVQVVAVNGRTAERSVTAGSGGRFVVRFQGMTANACRGLSVTALGNRGSRAVFKRAPGQCPSS